ncbi:conserved hypothetical protein [Trichinella spiralis]|uniref:hypothetical protein n=1 Tax=Trichinella spiralis TaxID=6334 RepID=UPI0001EFD1C1|nr:conserved hypothetical protein [Trichinella spiralis]
MKWPSWDAGPESQRPSWLRVLSAAWHRKRSTESSVCGNARRMERQPGPSRGSPDPTVGPAGDDTGKIEQQTTRLKGNGVLPMRRTGPFPSGLPAATRRSQSAVSDGDRRPAERTMATINPQTGNVLAVPGRIENLEISLLVDSGAVVSVISKRMWDMANSCRKLRGVASPIQLGDGRKMATFGWGVVQLHLVVVVEKLVVPGILGTNFLDTMVRSMDCRSRYMVLRDGTRVKFQREACCDAPFRIGCMGTGVPQEGTGQVTTGKPAQAIEGRGQRLHALADAAECWATGKQTFESILRWHSRAISRNDDDLGRTGLVAHRIETGEAQPIK